MHYDITCDINNLRFDKFVSNVSEISRSQLQNASNIFINGKAGKLSTIVNAGDKITFDLISKIPSVILPQKIPLNIIFENENVLVLNKSCGVAVHPSISHFNDTLVNGVMYYLNLPAIKLPKNCSEEELLRLARPLVVHRLDLDTSGVIIFGKNSDAQKFLQEQFMNRRVKKIYNALVVTKNIADSGTIDYDLARDVKDRKKFAAYKNKQLVKNGYENTGIFLTEGAKLKSAITHYKVISRTSDYSFLEITLDTGRTHQIRVHTAAIGAPVAGDVLYGNKAKQKLFNRLMLHSKILSITLPGECSPCTFTAEFDAQFNSELKKAQLY